MKITKVIIMVYEIKIIHCGSFIIQFDYTFCRILEDSLFCELGKGNGCINTVISLQTTSCASAFL